MGLSDTSNWDKTEGESIGQLSVVAALVKILEDLGVQYAFGVSGGAIASLWGTLCNSSIQVVHFRHESGAAFAATEAYFASGRPVVVFTTTGPGITNALTGLFGARSEGAKVILLSGYTSAPLRGRWACQETSTYTMPMAGIFTSGPVFNYATVLENSDELLEVSRRLALGLAQSAGFVAHVSIPTALQSSSLKAPLPQVSLCHSLAIASASEETILKCVRLLSEGRFAIWVGFGARGAAVEIRQLAERTGAAVMCSPRGKGIFPEDHPQFIGITGFAGHESVLQYMKEQQPLHVLVLGTRLGELTSLWNSTMIPSHGFLHVDIDPDVPGTAYPAAETIAIQSDIKVFVQALLKYFPKSSTHPTALFPHCSEVPAINSQEHGLVRPQLLMSMIQRVIVEGSNAVVMAEGGNALAWVTHLLRFSQPKRYRISTGFAAMGHCVTGVVGAALAHNGKAVAIVGDGAMLMNCEISTAVKCQCPAVWVVLNDGRYNMCEQGMAYLGLKGADAKIPQVDFVSIARGMGADGVCVERETDVQEALLRAMAFSGPFVVDIILDASQVAPAGSRNKSLMSQISTTVESTS